MVDSYGGAVARFSAAIRKSEQGDEARAALFEALNWAHAIDDQIGELWRPHGAKLGLKWRDEVEGTEIVAGVRYVRNRVHHQMADALKSEEGARFPMRFPVVFFSWIWRPAVELPAPDKHRRDEQGRAAYEATLANVRAEDTLIALGDVFEKVMNFLEPPRAPSRAAPIQSG